MNQGTPIHVVGCMALAGSDDIKNDVNGLAAIHLRKGLPGVALCVCQSRGCLLLLGVAPSLIQSGHNASRLLPLPVDTTKKRRIMVNLDRVLAMLVDEAAGLERRTAAQWLTNAIEDALMGLPDTKLESMYQRMETTLEMIENDKEKMTVKAQWEQLQVDWADRQSCV